MLQLLPVVHAKNPESLKQSLLSELVPTHRERPFARLLRRARSHSA